METPFTVASAVLAAVQDALTVAGRPVGTALVIAGGLAVDECCDGLLAVAPERVFRTLTPFPTEALADERCVGTPIGIDVVVFVTRCIPVSDDRGNPPAPAELSQAFADVLIDAAIVWNTVTSAAVLGLDAYGDPLWERANVSQSYSGPAGQCVTSETRLSLGIPSSLWCVVA